MFMVKFLDIFFLAAQFPEIKIVVLRTSQVALLCIWDRERGKC